ncbi:cGAS-like receptor 1 isoform X2 [Lasioglossum baleicum]|uniref:cGAS-like receptor 1 isoform X2 n=1 Tax=Lasioglossum baleicum TaxID=434251 RepID=UPI003FCDA2F4
MDENRLKDHLSNDKVLQLVHSKFIKLQMDEVAETRILLDQVVNDLIDRMKRQDPLFERLYNKIVFCGSFYKGTKISKPNEFDLNIILNLSKCTVHPNNIHLSFTQPAFVKIEISKSYNTPATKYNMSAIEKKKLNSLIVDGYLHPHRFRSWVEGVLECSIRSKLPLEYDSKIRLITIRKGGPAFTLELEHLRRQGEQIHIDIVPALNFDTEIIVDSPVNFKEIQKYNNKEWFAVSVPKNTINGSNDNLHWRQSFFYQEKEILQKNGRIKYIIRLMKKLRDNQKWANVASYFIETLSFNKLESIKEQLDRMPLTWLFYLMLKEMLHDFEKHMIPYFWDERYNLLLKIGEREMFNIECRLRRIIYDIKRKASTNPFVIAEQILNRTELQELHVVYSTEQIADLNIDGIDEEEKKENTSWCALF